MEKQRALGEKKPRGLSALKSMVLKDQERWERNRLTSSGVVEGTGLDNDEDDGTERVSIIVHAIKPPFLDGRVTFTTQKKMVSTVKDESSDFAKLAKNGSPLVREMMIKVYYIIIIYFTCIYYYLFYIYLLLLFVERE